MLYFGLKETLKAFWGVVKMLTESLVRGVSKKREIDDGLISQMAILMALVLFVLLCVIAWGLKSCTQKIRYGDLKLEAIEVPPLTEEMLGLSANNKPIVLTKKADDRVYLEYTATLSNGNYLKYTYSCYYREEDAEMEWERSNNWIENGLKGEYYQMAYDWNENKMDLNDLDHVKIFVFPTDEKETNKYVYNIQNKNVHMKIENSGECFSKEQLQLLAKVLLSQ